MASTITVKNIGPVEELSLPVPENGGLVVLRGRNGSGKTHTLRAVEAAVTGKGRPSVRDGALRGEVSACGVTMKVGRTTRRSGELVVETLDGRLNVADLVDPGLKTPEAADAKRIKALVSLVGAKPDPSWFSPLFASEDQFREVVKASTLETDDVVTLAERIKRDCEAAARKEESLAQHAAGEAKGKREAAQDAPLDAEADPVYLQQQLEEAIQHHSALLARREEAARHAEERAAAMEEFRKLEESYEGQPVDWHRQAVAAAENIVQQKTDRVRDLERQLAAAKTELEVACTEQAAAVRALKAAEQREQLKKRQIEILNRESISGPDDSEVETAAAAVERARSAVETGALVRQAKKMLREATELEDVAAHHSERAAALREAAKGTDEVLSQVVSQAGSELRVEAGRLVLDTHRGATFYAELSDGEKWRVALDIAIKAVGSRGLLVIPQHAWESLDASVRSQIAEHVRSRGIVVLTAEADHEEPVGELRAEVYSA